MKSVLWSAAALSMMSGAAVAQDTDLAKKLSNPVASLISVPFQFNHDRGYGPSHDGYRSYMNIQPVIPFSISEDWNLISRTILPVTYQHDVPDGSGYAFGLGDTVQSLFFSPKEAGPGGIIWGIGPVFLIPTGTEHVLGANSWGAGPTGVVLKQTGPWTLGVLANHIWSVGGQTDISSTFVQPFVSYTTSDAWTYTLNSESTYDWKADEASIPINAVVTKLLTVGDRPISVGGGVRYWADSPDGGPNGFGFRLMATLIFPK